MQNFKLKSFSDIKKNFFWFIFSNCPSIIIISLWFFGKKKTNSKAGGFWPHDASRTRIVTFFLTRDLFKNYTTRVVKCFSQR
jgi:hypothetical protein